MVRYVYSGNQQPVGHEARGLPNRGLLLINGQEGIGIDEIAPLAGTGEGCVLADVRRGDLGGAVDFLIQADGICDFQRGLDIQVGAGVGISLDLVGLLGNPGHARRRNNSRERPGQWESPETSAPGRLASSKDRNCCLENLKKMSDCLSTGTTGKTSGLKDQVGVLVRHGYLRQGSINMDLIGSDQCRAPFSRPSC